MVFGNLSTGYWLGAAATAGLHWVELGRTTLTGTSDNIDVGAAAGWTLHSSSSIANGKITCTNTGESYKTYSGLGKPTDFVWDFTFTRNSGDAGNTSAIILSSHNGGYGDPSSGQTNVQFYLANGNVTTLSVRKNSGSGNVQTECDFGVGSSSTNIQPTGTTKYYRIIKDGADFTMKRYGSDSDRTSDSSVEASDSATMTSTATSTWNSGSGDLSHIVIDGHGSGAKNYSIDDIKFYKDKTTATGTPEINETFSDLTAKPYMMMLLHKIGANVNPVITFNSDTGSNYARRYTANGSGNSTNVNQAKLECTYAGATPTSHAVITASNKSDQEKLLHFYDCEEGTAGAGNAPNRMEVVGKWANTSDQITSVSFGNDDSGDYAAGSEVVVLGYDPDDTEGTSVWEELANVTTSTAGDVDTGTFTSKKYLWVQIQSLGNGDVNNRLRFNNDSSGNYAYRVSGNGGSDSTSTTPSGIPFGNGNTTSPDNAFDNFFIINKSDKEKLVIGHTITDEGTGAGNAPQRNEIVAKWANTSAQINRINLVNVGSGNHSAGSKITVWGFD